MKEWKIASTADGPARELARQARLPIPLADLLVRRGISTAADADRFLNPRLSDIADPFSIPGMEVAIDRIWQAIRDQTPIVVHGDYDMDGVTSAALVSQVLSGLGVKVFHSLPHRIDDGYGLGVDAVERCILAHKPGLIITTDCGSGSHEAVAAARVAGVDVVVTDHHEISGSPAAAVAVVNPKLGTDPSARALAGVGVAFKVCHALLKKGRESRRKLALEVDLRRHLDLVALGTVADMVPLTGENRIFVRHGLAQLNRRERKGLNALTDVAGAKGEMGTYHIGYVLGPRMNAVGRLGNAGDALELLLTDDEGRARDLALGLDAANRERKQIETDIMEAAIRQIEERFDPDTHFGIVVGQRGWHVGVVGIVASRLVNRYGRPAIVIGFGEDGLGRGSCRSVPGFDLLSGLKSCAGHLSRFGGHEMAAGLSLHQDHFAPFEEAFRRACAASLQGRDLKRTLEVEGWVSLPEILDGAFMDVLGRMAPFGEGNPEPVWGLRQVQIIGAPRVLKEAHLKFRIGLGGDSCEVIGFNLADRLDQLPEGGMDLAFYLRQNSYMGRTAPQLQLLDFRASRGV